ncbi:MAG TPA: hypothetical protein VLK58_18915, partial [Conexibacter sp.]|nr:hypothetical protein [Conexibacter sp.]
MSQTTTCRTCGASLAPDQRYCLGCGTRVAAPRLDFLAESERAEAAARAAAGAGPDAPTAIHPTAAGVAGAAPGTVGAAGAPAPAPSRLDKVGGPMGAAAVVLVALGVYAWRALGAAYGVFVLGSLALPFSDPVPATPLLSIPRFALGVFPVFIALGLLGKSERVHT